MKIFQIIDSLEIGGAERMAVNLSNAFSDNFIDNSLICTRKPGPLKKFISVKSTFFSLNKKNKIDFFAFLRFFKIVKSERPTIIHAHSTSIYWALVICFLFPKIKLIWHDHFGIENRINSFNRKLIKFFSKKIFAVISVNEKLYYWSKENLIDSKVFFLRNFPYLEINKKNKKNKKEKNIILHLANLRPEKNHINLVRAVIELKKIFPDTFQVWCAGHDNFDHYSSKIKNMIKEQNLINEIKILGSVNNVEVLLENADVGILCSDYEGLPVSLLEYGLASLPVVVTDVGQCSDVIKNGLYGSIVEVNNHLKLAEEISNLLSNPENSITKGKSFKKHVELTYGPTNFIKKYKEILKA